MNRITLAVAVVALTSSAAMAWDDDFFGGYLQRKDTVTLDAGNAKEINSATHIIDPFPPAAFDRRIPGNGERMVGAVERYRDPSKLNRAPCPPVPQFEIEQAGVKGQTAIQCGAANIVQGAAANQGAPGSTTSTRVIVPAR